MQLVQKLTKRHIALPAFMLMGISLLAFNCGGNAKKGIQQEPVIQEQEKSINKVVLNCKNSQVSSSNTTSELIIQATALTNIKSLKLVAKLLSNLSNPSHVLLTFNQVEHSVQLGTAFEIDLAQFLGLASESVLKEGEEKTIALKFCPVDPVKDLTLIVQLQNNKKEVISDKTIGWKSDSNQADESLPEQTLKGGKSEGETTQEQAIDQQAEVEKDMLVEELKKRQQAIAKQAAAAKKAIDEQAEVEIATIDREETKKQQKDAEKDQEQREKQERRIDMEAVGEKAKVDQKLEKSLQDLDKELETETKKIDKKASEAKKLADRAARVEKINLEDQVKKTLQDLDQKKETVDQKDLSKQLKEEDIKLQEIKQKFDQALAHSIQAYPHLEVGLKTKTEERKKLAEEDTQKKKKNIIEQAAVVRRTQIEQEAATKKEKIEQEAATKKEKIEQEAATKKEKIGQEAATKKEETEQEAATKKEKIDQDAATKKKALLQPQSEEEKRLHQKSLRIQQQYDQRIKERKLEIQQNADAKKKSIDQQAKEKITKIAQELAGK